MDGEHHAVEEAVAKAAAAGDAEVGRLELGAGEAHLLELTHHRDARAGVGVAEVPTRADVGVEAARLEVGARRGRAFALAAHEARGIGLLGGLERVDDTGALGAAGAVGRPLLDVDVGAFRQVANRVEEVEPLALHDVVEDVAARVAAEAVPQAGRGRHVERRALLLMEGAAAPEVVAARAQDDRLGDEVDDVGRLADALLVLV